MATRNSKIKDGARFEADIIKSAKAIGAHVHKIPTTKWQGYGVNSIYDIMLLYNGIYAAIECKVIHAIEAFPFDRVKEHQINALKDVHNNGGRGLILINVRIPRHQEVKVIPVTQYEHLMSTLTRKSIPADILSKLNGIKKTGGTWDIKGILNLVYP